MKPYTVTKTYGHEQGLSCVFRQHRAKSHCQYLHGYALAFDITFCCEKLDANGWVVDFGSLTKLKENLQAAFDHKMLVARDDPALPLLEVLGKTWDTIAQVMIVDATGCEAFAKLVHDLATDCLTPGLFTQRGVMVEKVTCREHAGNCATYHGYAKHGAAQIGKEE